MILRHIIISAASILAISCSCSSGEATASGATDKEAAKAGEEAARSVIAVAADESSLTDCLLEVRSQVYQISQDQGEAAAADFEAAFEQYIRQHNDSLARILF